jgi:hypothetical protein
MLDVTKQSTFTPDALRYQWVKTMMGIGSQKTIDPPDASEMRPCLLRDFDDQHGACGSGGVSR